jgi:hypothetical protein
LQAICHPEDASSSSCWVEAMEAVSSRLPKDIYTFLNSADVASIRVITRMARRGIRIIFLNSVKTRELWNIYHKFT